MNITADQMEDIVRVVLQRLRSEVPAPAITPSLPSPAVSTDATGGNSASTVSEQPGRLRLSERVVTLELLKGKLDGLTALVVHPKAVVTPAVLDELRRRQLRLHRELPTTVHVQRHVPLLLVCPNQHLVAIGKRVCSQQATTIVDAGSENSLAAIRNHLQAGGQAAVWCSTNPFAAIASTFGDSTLRPLSLNDLKQLSAALTQARPNLIIVDAQAWSVAAINNLVATWTRSLR